MNTIKTYLFLAAMVMSGILFAQKTEMSIDQFYPIDAGHSYIEFSIKYMGYAKVKGRFSEFSGMFRYIPENAMSTSVNILIKVESIDTDLEFRDKDLKSENWFDAEKYPTITFKSKKVVKQATGFDLIGDLNIKAITKEITIHLDPPSGILKDVRGDLQVIFSGSATLDRTDFGVEGKRWSAIKEGITAVDNTVNIEFSILGKRYQSANYSNFVSNSERPPGVLYKKYKENGAEACIEEFTKLKDQQALNENALITVAQMLLLEGNTNEAIQLLEANYKAYPNSTDVLYALGKAYATGRNWSKAKGYLEKVLQLDANHSAAFEVFRNIQHVK